MNKDTLFIKYNVYKKINFLYTLYNIICIIYKVWYNKEKDVERG